MIERLKIARKTLNMNDVMIAVMGGMTREEAEKIVKEAKDEAKNKQKERQG